MPPSIKRIYDTVYEGGSVTIMETTYLNEFLRCMGLRLEDCLKFWVCCKPISEQLEYSIRHSYGFPIDKRKILSFRQLSLGASTSVFASPESLSDVLKPLSRAHASKVAHHVSNGDECRARLSLFEATHDGHFDANSCEYPSEWFESSEHYYDNRCRSKTTFEAVLVDLPKPMKRKRPTETLTEPPKLPPSYVRTLLQDI